MSACDRPPFLPCHSRPTSPCSRAALQPPRPGRCSHTRTTCLGRQLCPDSGLSCEGCSTYPSSWLASFQQPWSGIHHWEVLIRECPQHSHLRPQFHPGQASWALPPHVPDSSRPIGPKQRPQSPQRGEQFHPYDPPI